MTVAAPLNLSGLESLLDSLDERLLPPEPLGEIPDDYEGWLARFFPEYVRAAMAEHHHRIWRWIWALELGVRAETSMVGLLARGGGKSTTIELGCAALGARQKRRYILYVCGTQPQADDHVANIAALLESPRIAASYPTLGQRLCNVYGTSKGWRRNRIRSEAGLTVDALGLEVMARGVKLEEQRPDLIVFDDVDDRSDSELTIQKKISNMTTKILPAGSNDAATIFIQNLVHYEGVAARLAGVASEEADFLADREVIGPIPAVIGLEMEPIPNTTRYRITKGTPTWEGQDIPTCEAQINKYGPRAFLSEAQHKRPLPDDPAFPEFDESMHVCEPFSIPPTWSRWRSIDYGYSSPYCCLWLTRSPAGHIYAYRERYTPPGERLTGREQA